MNTAASSRMAKAGDALWGRILSFLIMSWWGGMKLSDPFLAKFSNRQMIRAYQKLPTIIASTNLSRTMLSCSPGESSTEMTFEMP